MGHRFTFGVCCSYKFVYKTSSLWLSAVCEGGWHSASRAGVEKYPKYIDAADTVKLVRLFSGVVHLFKEWVPAVVR